MKKVIEMGKSFNITYTNQSDYLEAWEYLVKVNSPFKCNPIVREIIIQQADYQEPSEFTEDVNRLRSFDK